MFRPARRRLTNAEIPGKPAPMNLENHVLRRFAEIAVLSGISCSLAGCSLGEGLTTGSIFGGSQKTSSVEAAAPAAPVSDPTGRAMQVGSVSARATKCGYNFDPAKLKANFLASEVALGASPADIERISQIYDISRNGVAKAVAGNSTYCSDEKTAQIKADLTRHLAGDYTPSARRPEAAPEDGGLLGDFFGEGGGSSSDAQGHRQIDALTK
jgi:hypothetical protein